MASSRTSWRSELGGLGRTKDSSRIGKIALTGLKAPGRMDGRDAAGEIAEAHALETGRLDALGERRLRRKTPDALDQILVGGAIPRDDGTDQRHEAEGIGLVEPVEAGHDDAAEFETIEAPARFQHAARF